MQILHICTVHEIHEFLSLNRTELLLIKGYFINKTNMSNLILHMNSYNDQLKKKDINCNIAN